MSMGWQWPGRTKSVGYWRRFLLAVFPAAVNEVLRKKIGTEVISMRRLVCVKRNLYPSFRSWHFHPVFHTHSL